MVSDVVYGVMDARGRWCLVMAVIVCTKVMLMDWLMASQGMSEVQQPTHQYGTSLNNRPHRHLTLKWDIKVFRQCRDTIRLTSSAMSKCWVVHKSTQESIVFNSRHMFGLVYCLFDRASAVSVHVFPYCIVLNNLAAGLLYKAFISKSSLVGGGSLIEFYYHNINIQ